MPFLELPRVKTWSFSSWSTYQQCPLKLKFSRIDGIKAPPSPAMERGTEMHLTAQNYIEGKSDELPWASLEDKFTVARNARAMCELEWGFTRTWEPCGWNDPNVWCRVKPDAVYTQKTTAYVVDHKSGKCYPEHATQLELYALATLIMLPKTKSVQAEDWYLDQGVVSEPAAFSRDAIEGLKAEWGARVSRMMRDTIFPAKPSPRCKWCYYSKCNNGPCSF